MLKNIKNQQRKTKEIVAGFIHLSNLKKIENVKEKVKNESKIKEKYKNEHKI